MTAQDPRQLEMVPNWTWQGPQGWFSLALADTGAAIEAVARREALIDREVERESLLATLADEMSRPELAEHGPGNVDPARFALAIGILVGAEGLPRPPETGAVFSDAFLPPQQDRVCKLS
ncbi:MAG: hypothetical protein ACOCY0_00345 [Roseicyclus sp.]